MTAKSPEVIYLIDTGDGVAWCGDPDPTGYGECDDAVKYVRGDAYEALKAEYEEELFQVRQDRDAHFGELMRALEQVDAMKAECALMREQLDAMAEYKVAAHQLIGIPASVGISEPIEGFAKRPQDIMPAVRDMALRIELLEHQAAERERLLAESRANDQQAMAYLNEVRAIVGADDFPDMVRRCERLQAKCARLQAAMIEAKGHIDHYMYGGSSYREPAAKAVALIDDAIDAATQGDQP